MCGEEDSPNKISAGEVANRRPDGLAVFVWPRVLDATERRESWTQQNSHQRISGINGYRLPARMMATAIACQKKSGTQLGRETGRMTRRLFSGFLKNISMSKRRTHTAV